MSKFFNFYSWRLVWVTLNYSATFKISDCSKLSSVCDNPDSVLLFKNKYIFLILSTLSPTKILTLYFMFKHKYIVKQQLTNLISIQKD